MTEPIEVPEQDLQDGDEFDVEDIPQFIVLGVEVVGGVVGGFVVATTILTVEALNGSGRGGIALLVAPEDAIEWAAKLAAVGKVLPPTHVQLEAAEASAAKSVVPSTDSTNEKED